MTQFPPPARSGRPLLTPGEVSELLRIPTSTLAVWRSTGRVRLPFIKVGRAVRYIAADVHALAAGAEPSQP